MVKKLLYLCIALSFMVSFTSCSDDDNDIVNSKYSIGDYEKTTMHGYNVYFLKKDKAVKEVKNFKDSLNKYLPKLNDLMPKQATFFKTINLWIGSDKEEMAKWPGNGMALGIYVSKEDKDVIPEQRKSVLFNAYEASDKEQMKNEALLRLLVHELSHAWHFEEVADGWKNKEVEETYKNAMDKKLYANAKEKDGTPAKMYLQTNAYEYFSELSVIYFFGNYHQPFNKEELKKMDPLGFSMIERLWNIKK